MTQRNAYYQVMIGLPGCLPNSHEFERFETRHDMTRRISELLDYYGFSQRNRRQINIPEIWRYLQSGGRRGNFVIRGNMGNACNMEFVQIDLAEYRKGIAESEFA